MPLANTPVAQVFTLETSQKRLLAEGWSAYRRHNTDILEGGEMALNSRVAMVRLACVAVAWAVGACSAVAQIYEYQCMLI